MKTDLELQKDIAAELQWESIKETGKFFYDENHCN